MSFAEIFWIVSACAAVLFFAAGFAASDMRMAGGVGALAARAAEAAALREEKEAWLAEQRELRRYAAASHASYAELEAELIDASAAGGAGSGEIAVRPPPESGVRSFQTILESIGNARGMRAAVLGDDLGLPIATLGRHAEPLAGFSAFLAQAAKKGTAFLPFGRVRRIVVEDDRLTTITACTLAGSEIFLATFTSGPGPEAPKMTEVLESASCFRDERR